MYRHVYSYEYNAVYHLCSCSDDNKLNSIIMTGSYVSRGLLMTLETTQPVAVVVVERASVAVAAMTTMVVDVTVVVRAVVLATVAGV